MSLLEEAYEPFIIMDKTTKPDGYGGVETVWTEGAEVQAAATQTNSIESQIAQAMSEKTIYTVVTRRNVIFRYHDIIKRVRDGKIFRITSDADDLETPRSATLDMRQCTAEEWELAE